jgi:hypothetical protein
MKRFRTILLTVFVSLLFSGCAEDGFLNPNDTCDPAKSTLKSAKKPLPHLYGTQVCAFNPSNPQMFDCTIDFGDMGVYSITFIPHGPPRDFSQASPFEEDVIIHYLDTDWTNPQNVVLIGFAKGIHTLANRPPEPTHFATNGDILEAYGPFEMWGGRKLHSDGKFYWTPEGMPDRVECVWRIN